MWVRLIIAVSTSSKIDKTVSEINQMTLLLDGNNSWTIMIYNTDKIVEISISKTKMARKLFPQINVKALIKKTKT